MTPKKNDLMAPDSPVQELGKAEETRQRFGPA
jgi:hypothetical protein